MKGFVVKAMERETRLQLMLLPCTSTRSTRTINYWATYSQNLQWEWANSWSGEGADSKTPKTARGCVEWCISKVSKGFAARLYAVDLSAVDSTSASCCNWFAANDCGSDWLQVCARHQSDAEWIAATQCIITCSSALRNNESLPRIRGTATCLV